MATKKREKKKVFCPQGKTFGEVIRFKSNTGNIIDLTGYTATMEIRTQAPDPRPIDPTNDELEAYETALEEQLLITLTDSDMITIDGELGKVTIMIPDEVTATFPVGLYVWELELASPSGVKPYFMAPSPFQVLGEVTLS